MRSTTRSDLRGAVWAAGLALVALAGPARAACSLDQVDLKGDWGRASFRVEIADDGDERAQGLMNR